MLILSIFISVILLILNEAGVLILSSFYIWLPTYIGIGIFILQIVIMTIYVLVFKANKVKIKL